MRRGPAKDVLWDLGIAETFVFHLGWTSTGWKRLERAAAHGMDCREFAGRAASMHNTERFMGRLRRGEFLR